MEIERKRFQGVLNILNFNRQFYYFGVSALLVCLYIAYLSNLSSIFSILLIAVFSYGLLMPLVVSAYVYDFSDYYSLKWLDQLIENKSTPIHAVNINAGFDETSYIIKDKLKTVELQVYDFYDENLHTEAAIVRARKVSQVYPSTKTIETNSIPEKDSSVDIIFLLSSAHEIRNIEERKQFFKECYRICKPNGKVIMVEHLRDLPNFFAFTVGFNHFFSRRVWKNAFVSAGFTRLHERKFTPFMSIFEIMP